MCCDILELSSTLSSLDFVHCSVSINEAKWPPGSRFKRIPTLAHTTTHTHRRVPNTHVYRYVHSINCHFKLSPLRWPLKTYNSQLGGLHTVRVCVCVSVCARISENLPENKMPFVQVETIRVETLSYNWQAVHLTMKNLPQ